jgi:hypothetical protein
MAIFDQLRARYAEDPTIMSIVRAGEEVCTYTEEPAAETPTETTPEVAPTEGESSP